MPRWLPRAFFGVLVVGGIILIVTGVINSRPGWVWTGAGFGVISVVVLAFMLAPKLREERERLDIVLANPDALIIFGWLGDELSRGPSVLVADTASVRILARSDRTVSAEFPWRDVDDISMWAQALPGGRETRALLIRPVAGEALTFWVDRALAPAFLEDLVALRERALAAG